MNDWLTAFNDPAFYKGALIMGILMLVLMIYSRYMYSQTLYIIAKNKGCEKIGDKFYYLVESSEYLALTLPHLPKFGESEEQEPVVETMIPFLMYVNRGAWNEYYCGSQKFNGTPVKSPDIRASQFYWSAQEAEKDQEAFRAIYALDRDMSVYIARLDMLGLDSVAYNALLTIARNELAPSFNKEN
jgi:hypothetical protein